MNSFLKKFNIIKGRIYFMVKKFVIFLILVTFFSLPVMAQEVEQENDKIVAVINEENITDYELEQFAGVQQLVMTLYQSNQEFASELMESKEGKEVLNRFKKLKLENLIQQTLLEQEADSRNISISEKEKNESFDKHLNQIEQQYNLNEEQLLETLSQQGINSIDKYKEMYLKNSEQNILINKLRQEVVNEEKVEISDKQIEDYYNENKSSYNQEAQVKASHILLETEEEANNVLDKLENGTKFSELAEKYSTDDGSASQGGDLGFFGKGQMIPEFEEAAFELRVDEISEPVKSQYGYHVIKVTEKNEAGTQSLEEVEDEIEQKLLSSEKQRVWGEFMDELRENADIDIRI